MNKRMMSGAAVVALLAAGLLTGCGADLEPSDPPKPPPSADATEPVEAEPVVEEPVEEGTFANPFPAGTPVGNEEVTIALGAPVDFTGGYLAANQFNSAPLQGAYVNVPVTIQNLAAEKVTWIDVRVKIVAADGRSWDSTIVTQDGDLSDMGDLYPGGTGGGVITFDMPLDALTGALAAVTYSWSDEVFVKVQ